MAKNEWNWGQDVDEFPSALWDDIDAKVALLEYQSGDYGTQVFMAIRPEAYEFEARNMEFEDDVEYNPQADRNPGFAMGWYGLGSGDYEISEDGMDISGPAPQRSTGGVKLLMSLRSAGKVKFNSASLVPAQDLVLHFKATMETRTNPQTKEKTERAVLYCVGKAVGHAVVGEAKAESGGSGRKSRRGAASADEGESESEEAPARGRGRSSSRGRGRGRAAKAETVEEAPAEEPESEAESTESEPEAGADSLDEALNAISRVVADAGDEGLAKRRLSNGLLKLQEELGEDVIKLAVQATTLKEAIKDELIKDEDGRLFLA